MNYTSNKFLFSITVEFNHKKEVVGRTATYQEVVIDENGDIFGTPKMSAEQVPEEDFSKFMIDLHDNIHQQLAEATSKIESLKAELKEKDIKHANTIDKKEREIKNIKEAVSKTPNKLWEIVSKLELNKGETNIESLSKDQRDIIDSIKKGSLR